MKLYLLSTGTTRRCGSATRPTLAGKTCTPPIPKQDAGPAPGVSWATPVDKEAGPKKVVVSRTGASARSCTFGRASTVVFCCGRVILEATEHAVKKTRMRTILTTTLTRLARQNWQRLIAFRRRRATRRETLLLYVARATRQSHGWKCQTLSLISKSWRQLACARKKGHNEDLNVQDKAYLKLEPKVNFFALFLFLYKKYQAV